MRRPVVDTGGELRGASGARKDRSEQGEDVLLPGVGETGRRVAVELKGIPVVVFGVARKLENNVLGNVNGDDKAGNRIALVGENVVGVAAEAVRGRRHCGEA